MEEATTEVATIKVVGAAEAKAAADTTISMIEAIKGEGGLHMTTTKGAGAAINLEVDTREGAADTTKTSPPEGVMTDTKGAGVMIVAGGEVTTTMVAEAMTIGAEDRQGEGDTIGDVSGTRRSLSSLIISPLWNASSSTSVRASRQSALDHCPPSGAIERVMWSLLLSKRQSSGCKSCSLLLQHIVACCGSCSPQHRSFIPLHQLTRVMQSGTCQTLQVIVITRNNVV